MAPNPLRHVEMDMEQFIELLLARMSAELQPIRDDLSEVKTHVAVIVEADYGRRIEKLNEKCDRETNRLHDRISGKCGPKGDEKKNTEFRERLYGGYLALAGAGGLLFILLQAYKLLKEVL